MKHIPLFSIIFYLYTAEVVVLGKEYENDPKPCKHPGIGICIEENRSLSIGLDPALASLQNERANFEPQISLMREQCRAQLIKSMALKDFLDRIESEILFIQQGINSKENNFLDSFLVESTLKKIFSDLPGINSWPEAYPMERKNHLRKEGTKILQKLKESDQLIEMLKENERLELNKAKDIESNYKKLRDQKDQFEYMIRGGCHDLYCRNQ